MYVLAASLNTDDPAGSGRRYYPHCHVAAPRQVIDANRFPARRLTVWKSPSGAIKTRCAKKWPRRKIALLTLTLSACGFNAIPCGEMRHLRQDTASRDVLPTLRPKFNQLHNLNRLDLPARDFHRYRLTHRDGGIICRIVTRQRKLCFSFARPPSTVSIRRRPRMSRGSPVFLR